MSVSFAARCAAAIDAALRRLARELSPRLTYHNLWHTQQGVMPAVALLSENEGLSAEERSLALLGAAYHDLGFVQTYQGHEAAGAELARQMLPGFGFDPKQVERVCGMVLATHLPQSPANPLEAVVCDADLDVLGREDFFAQNDALYRETCALVAPVSPQDWLRGQVQFLAGHQYFTGAAQALREPAKKAHLASLQEKLNRQDP